MITTSMKDTIDDIRTLPLKGLFTTSEVMILLRDIYICEPQNEHGLKYESSQRLYYVCQIGIL